jgi:hypothetical protein
MSKIDFRKHFWITEILHFYIYYRFSYLKSEERYLLSFERKQTPNLLIFLLPFVGEQKKIDDNELHKIA